MLTQTASNRTFGVELELLVPVSLAGYTTVDQDDSTMRETVRTDVAKALAQVITAHGVTCAAEGYNHQTRAHWKLVPDGSLVSHRDDYIGIELVSPVLSGSAGLSQIEVVCEVLGAMKCLVNKNCGFHVHHDASDLTLANWKYLWRFFVKHEGCLDTFQPASRRENNNRFCLSTRRRFLTVEEGLKKIGAVSSFGELYQTCTNRSDYTNPHSEGRYYKLNMNAFWRHGTCEVRHHAGTIEYDKIAAWVVLTQSIVEDSVRSVNCRFLPFGADRFDFVLSVVPAGDLRREVSRFYKNRAATLAA